MISLICTWLSGIGQSRSKLIKAGTPYIFRYVSRPLTFAEQQLLLTDSRMAKAPAGHCFNRIPDAISPWKSLEIYSPVWGAKCRFCGRLEEPFPPGWIALFQPAASSALLFEAACYDIWLRQRRWQIRSGRR